MTTIQRTSNTSPSHHEMYVVKRDGTHEEVSFDKILRRIRTLGSLRFDLECIHDPAIQISQSQRPNATELDINYTDLTIKVIDQIYDGITTKELDKLTAEQCVSLTTTHPDYGVLASRVVISNHHKNTIDDYATIVEQLYHHTDVHNIHSPIVDEEFYKLVMKYRDTIQSWFEFQRDYLVDFFGFKTLERAYLLRIRGQILERPQHMFMRVALGIHGEDLERAKQTYDMMSHKYFTHATPTLFNAGTPRPQMSSCYLLSMEKDSIDGIYNTLADCAKISKWAGGIGLHIHNIRAKGSLIRGTNGTSNGIVPMLRVFNNTARYVDQCFTRDTNVKTSDGFVPIDKVIPHSTNVITGSGKTFRVKELVEHPPRNRQMIDLYVEYRDRPLQITNEHLMLVFRNRKCIHPREYNRTSHLTAYKQLLGGDDLPDTMYVECDGGFMSWTPASDLTYNDWCCSMDSQGTLHYSQVVQVKQFTYSDKVYDLVVDTEHHYHTEAGVVHNGGGKRAGSFAIYIEPWHSDIDDFLEMRKNHGDEESKARDLFYALWIPDLFMKRVQENKDWTLMCPDECTGLSDVCGDDFVELYERYEREGKGRHTVPARDLWLRILDSQIETGTPYLLYKDSANRKSNQQNLGVIKSSNLCVAPETKILTDRGYIQIQQARNKVVNVWNGDEYSSVLVQQTGQNQELVRVCLTNGMMLDCTRYHKFYIEQNGACIKVEAQYLQSQMNLWSWIDPYTAQPIHHTVDKVEFIRRFDDTYCFNEPKRHMGVFNGILTGQCTEIIEYSDENETAVCNLGSIALPRFVEHPTIQGSFTVYSRSNCKFCQMAISYLKRLNLSYRIINADDDSMRTGIFHALSEKARSVGKEFKHTVPQIVYKEKTDESSRYIGGYEDLIHEIKPTYNFDKLYDITRILTRNLNRVIDLNFYPTDKTKRSNMRHRPIGIGVQGLADTFALMNITFTGDEARKLNQHIFETIYYASLKESVQLAQEEGPYETFQGSPMSKGILQFDMWERTPLTTQNGNWRYDWDTLRNEIQTVGIRNSLLVAPMPTASTSQILGYNECFEPFTNNIYMRRTLAGEFIVVNKYLLRELLDLKLWNKEMKNKIISANGSIQGIKEIPIQIREKYKIVWEMSMRTLIDLASDRGAYICQSQSMNLWMEEPNYKALTSMHFYTWSKGLKTGIYYLRTKAKASAQKFTVEPVNQSSSTSTSSKDKEEEEESCEMCSG